MALEDTGLSTKSVGHEQYTLLLCNNRTIINLISLDNNYDPEALIELQTAYQLKNIQLLQLWEDVWQTRRDQVLGRIKSILGLNVRLHARKGVVTGIDQQQADDFLNANHIQASAKARYKFALKIDEEIVAVACFSNVRFMKTVSTDYRSVELIRFATRIGFTVTGGFTKLLKHFIKIISPNDVMSYADRDWSLGNAYEQSGFKLVGLTPPAQIWLDRKELIRYFPHRLPTQANSSLNDDFLRVFNTGNLKYILYL